MWKHKRSSNKDELLNSNEDLNDQVLNCSRFGAGTINNIAILDHIHIVWNEDNNFSGPISMRVDTVFAENFSW